MQLHLTAVALDVSTIDFCHNMRTFTLLQDSCKTLEVCFLARKWKKTQKPEGGFGAYVHPIGGAGWHGPFPTVK